MDDIGELSSRLARAFGVPMPSSFVRLIAEAMAWSQEASGAPGWQAYMSGAFAEFAIADRDIAATAPELSLVSKSLYTAEQPEYFPFATPRTDGISYGYLVRAPECDQPEYPVVQFEPMEFRNELSFLGADTLRGLRTLLNETRDEAAESGDPTREAWSRLARFAQYDDHRRDVAVTSRPGAGSSEWIPLRIIRRRTPFIRERRCLCGLVSGDRRISGV